MIHVFKSAVIQKLLTPQDLDDLTKDFLHYKESNLYPDYFGRDVAYDHPHTPTIILQEKVRHIHLAEQASWPVRLIQFKRTSDRHLVYCQGAINSNCYLLITLLSPDAHSQAKISNVMRKIGEQAEIFRMKY